MEQRRVQQVDVETGEVMEAGALVFIPHRPRVREGWFMAFQDGLLALARDKTLTQQQWRVFAYLMGKLDFENYVHLSQAEIARGLGMKPSNVSAALAALVDKNVVARGPKVGRVVTMRLNSSLGWKGRVRSLEEQRRKGNLKLIVRTPDSVARSRTIFDVTTAGVSPEVAELGRAVQDSLLPADPPPAADGGSAGPDGPKQRG
jgi:DNA-binding transcriptional ArsR family regulator